jgi:hypothetical protein
MSKRIDDYVEIDDTEICYWKESGIWWLYLPGCGIANLANHTVVEHENKTITVSPSILLTGHDAGKPVTKHGMFERGVWKDV